MMWLCGHVLRCECANTENCTMKYCINYCYKSGWFSLHIRMNEMIRPSRLNLTILWANKLDTNLHSQFNGWKLKVIYMRCFYLWPMRNCCWPPVAIGHPHHRHIYTITHLIWIVFCAAYRNATIWICRNYIHSMLETKPCRCSQIYFNRNGYLWLRITLCLKGNFFLFSFHWRNYQRKLICTFLWSIND